MRNAIGAVADRLVAMVVPRTTAGACACFPEDRTVICKETFLWRCQLTCRCDPIHCVYLGRC